jgi:hypothetical protein
MTIRATKVRKDTTVTTATTTITVARVVPLADPATVTVAEMAGEVVVVTEVVDMAATVVEVVAINTVVKAMVVTVAVVTGNNYYKRGTRYLLLRLFNRVLYV